MAKRVLISEINLKIDELDGWSVSQGGRDTISRNFRFKNFSEAFGFMVRVALLCEKIDHHPEWSNTYNTVNVILTTHDVGGLSEKDILLAQKMNQIASNI